MSKKHNSYTAYNDMKKIFIITLISLITLFSACYVVVYYATYSQGNRSGELIKFSHRGALIKTWEGEISQGISGAQIFSFSVEGKNETLIQELENLQGRYVKLTYIERFTKLSWLGDTKYFITEVTEEESPHFRKR